MSIKLQLPKLVDVKPRLTVIGVGGAGCNAVNNMIAAGLQGVEFVVANTDAQSLAASSAEHRIQLGANLTEGLGAGSRPEIGEAAAEEALEEIRSHIAGAHMVFVAAGMGGGTGTGAAAVIARAAREAGALTVGIVCKPFQFEGARRMRIAETGVQTLRQHIDTLIVIPNQNLFRIANERTTFAEAFVLADQVLYSGIACIVELVLKEGLINLDFADVRSIMGGMGTAMMGTGEAAGDRRAVLAAEEAIANPLLDDVSLKGARGLLLSITGGRDMTLYEVDEAASRVRQEVDSEANIIVGATFDENLGDRIRVSIVASGMNRMGEQAQSPAQLVPHGQLPHGQLPQGLASQAAPVPAGAMPPPFPAPFPTSAQHTQPVAPAPAPRPPLPANEDVHRRLSEALEAAQMPAAPFNGQGANAYGGPPPYQPQIARQTWAAPGNVMIEEGLEGFPYPGAARPAGPPAPHNYALGLPPAPAFNPAPPAEFQRSQRRMPPIAEFPEIAQREWQAKKDGTKSVPVPQPFDHKKQGFFGRLTALGKRPQAAETQSSTGVQSPTGTWDDQVPMPVFVGRERR